VTGMELVGVMPTVHGELVGAMPAVQGFLIMRFKEAHLDEGLLS
jgi:hypothetical protein